MHIVLQNERVLLLREQPWLFWVGAGCLFILWLAVLRQELRGPADAAVLFLVLALAILPPVRTVRIDRSEGVILLQKRRLWLTKARSISLSSVRSVEIHQVGGRDSITALNLVLSDDRRLTIADAGRHHGFEVLADVMRAYLTGA